MSFGFLRQSVLEEGVTAVPANPQLDVSPPSLTFFAASGGGNPATQNIVITNVGTGQITTPTVVEDVAQTWLTESSATLIGPQQYRCTITAITGALGVGVYTVNLIVDTIESGQVIVPVTFNVQASLPTNTTPASLKRLRDNGQTSVIGWSGVPLPPGWLDPAELVKFRLVDGTAAEIPIYVEDFGIRHSDGSVKILYVEWSRTLPISTPETITMECGTPRNTQLDLPRQKPNGLWDYLVTSNNTSAWKTDTYPDAIINFPKEYLSTTQFWGAYDLRYEGEAGGPSWQDTWIGKWKTGSDVWWNAWISFTIPAQAATSFSRTQYDFPAHNFMLWCTTGDAEYYKRACATLVEWRNRYFRTNPKDGVPGGNIAIWEHCPWGLAFHFMLTGDNTSRTDLAGQAYKHSNPVDVTSSLLDYESEPRLLAYVLYSLMAAKVINATPPASTWDARTNSWLDKWLTVAAAHPGWIASGVNTGAFWNWIMYSQCSSIGSTGETTQNFMLGLLIHAIDQYIQFGDGTHNAIAQTRMAGLCDFLLTQDGTNTQGRYCVKYNNNNLGVNSACSGGQQGATFDGGQINLDGIFGGAFGVAYARLGTAAYQTAARSFIEVGSFSPNDGNLGPYIFSSSRTYNETFHRPWEGLAKVY